MALHLLETAFPQTSFLLLPLSASLERGKKLSSLPFVMPPLVSSDPFLISESRGHFSLGPIWLSPSSCLPLTLHASATSAPLWLPCNDSALQAWMAPRYQWGLVPLQSTRYGLRQGSSVNVLLFQVFIDDILSDEGCVVFMDDFALFASDESPKSLCTA